MKLTQSLGAKLAMVCAACLAAIVIGAAGMNAVSVGMLQETMRRESVRLAEEKGKQLALQLASLAESGGFEGQAASVNFEALREPIRIFIRDNTELVFACVIDENHNVVVSDFRDDATREILQGEIGEYEASFSHGDRALQVILERQPAPWPVITAPLPREARPGLRLAFAVNESEIYKRIADAGSRITRRVAGMTAVLCLALVLAFGAVWRLVARNERLLAENEGLSRQAYVASLASGVAHQIRNPLNAMCVNLDVIEEDLNDPRADSADRMRRLVRRLKTEARQLEGVVGGFLRFALPRATRPEPIRLALPIRAALEELEDEIAMRKATVELDLDERLEARGDAEGLRQVAHNLALNALQAMTGPERRLAIRARARGAQAVVAFEDTGEGIPPDRLERLFEVGGSTKPAGGGFGLAIVRRIVDDHGGAISVESAEGKGTKIEIRFPLISSPARR